MERIYLDELTNAIIRDLKTYTADVQEGVNDAVEYCTEYMRREAQKNSPVKTGGYKRGWTKSIEKKETRTTGRAWTEKNGRIEHLLEKGHRIGQKHNFKIKKVTAKGFERRVNNRKSNYSVKRQWVKPSPPEGHIEPAKEKALALFHEKIDEVLSTTK